MTIPINTVMQEFRFDPEASARIAAVVQNYPMSLADCAELLEWAAPLCRLLTVDGFINRMTDVNRFYATHME